MFYSPVNTIGLTDLLAVVYNILKGNQKGEFYNIIQSYFGRKVMDFNMGRNAFQYIVKKNKIKTIIMPAFLCSIFEDIIIQNNIKPIFVDIEIDTFNMSVSHLSETISRDVDAILVVHTFGNPANLNEIIELKEDYNTILIEDCAHSIGSKYNGVLTGCFGEYSFFSMNKYFPTTEGGFLLFDNDVYENLENKFNLKNMIRLAYMVEPLHGIIFKLKNSFGIGRKKFKDITSYRMESIKGCNILDMAIFNYFFKKLDKEIKIRNKICRDLDSNISNYFRKQKILDNCISSRQSYPILANSPDDVDIIVKYLKQSNIGTTRTWNDPIILSEKIRSHFKIDLSDFPNTLFVANRIINIPIHSYYSKKDIEYIYRSVNESVFYCSEHKTTGSSK